jgi:hypothetical protein
MRRSLFFGDEKACMQPADDPGQLNHDFLALRFRVRRKTRFAGSYHSDSIQVKDSCVPWLRPAALKAQFECSACVLETK